MDIEKLIGEYIQNHKYEIVSRTCDFLKIESISTKDDSGKPYGRQCANALDYCDNLCKEKNLVTKNFDYHCIEAKLNENQSGKRLVIATHADVVPMEDPYIYPPFAGKVYGDYIMGRGAVDNKGPLMATLYALAFFKEYNIPLKNDIRLYFGSNEECGMDDLQYYLDITGQPDWGLSVDDDFPTVIGEKGVVGFSITAPKSEHVELLRSYGTSERLIHDYCESVIDGEKIIIGRSENILNPVLYRMTKTEVPLFKNPEDEKIIKALLNDISGKLLDIEYSDEFSGKTVIKVLTVDTKDDNITLTFDIRVPVTVKNPDVIAKVNEFAKAHNLDIKIVRDSKGYYNSPDHPMVSLLTNLYNEKMNANEKPYVMSACTYARMFDHGCGFGAGNPHETKPFPKGHGGCHGPDEAHNIPVLLEAIRMLILGIKTVDEYWS